MRLLLGIIVGVAVGFAAIMGVEILGHAVYPPQPGVDFGDSEQLSRYTSQAPAGAMAMIAAAWFAGALAGAWTATAVARRTLAGWIIALLVLAASLTILILIPGHPVWMWPAAVILPLVAGWLAQRLAKPAA